jgi:hypothetical protein
VALYKNTSPKKLEALRSRVQQLAAAKLSGQDRKMLRMMAAGKSDGAILKAMGMSRGQGAAWSNTVRGKLGLKATDRLRDAAKKLTAPKAKTAKPVAKMTARKVAPKAKLMSRKASKSKTVSGH